MGLWTDETFATPSDGSLTITVPDSIYVGVVLDAADQFHSQLRKCWATPTSDPNDALNYPFIKDFCGDEMELYEYESLQESQKKILRLKISYNENYNITHK